MWWMWRGKGGRGDLLGEAGELGSASVPNGLPLGLLRLQDRNPLQLPLPAQGRLASLSFRGGG